MHQAVDAVKTPESNRAMHIDAAMLEGLKDWKKLTQFSGPDDWMFASRSWLDAVGTPLGVLQELMRHADIRTNDECLWSCGKGGHGRRERENSRTRTQRHVTWHVRVCK